MVVDQTLISTQALISAGAPLAGGGLLGLAAGYALKKVMKFALIGFGLLILVIGYLEYKHWISVNWVIIENQTSVIMSHIAHKAYVVTRQMGHEAPIGLGVVGFMPGLAIGLLKG
jgi:uncharacterized membrane protein (Fun14 family)